MSVRNKAIRFERPSANTLQKRGPLKAEDQETPHLFLGFSSQWPIVVEDPFNFTYVRACLYQLLMPHMHSVL